MFKKISIALIILIFTAGIVFAINVEDFKAPSGFEKGSGDYFDKDGYEISIVKYSDSSKDILFESEDDYKVSEYGGNIYKYTDKMVKHVGFLEVVEIDGQRYTVECYKDDTTSSSGSAYDYLTEFNSLNGLTPIEP